MRVVIANENASPKDWYRQAVLSVGLECEAADCVPYSELPVRLATGAVDLALVVVPGGAVTESALATVGHAAALGLPVFATGQPLDPQDILDLIRHGAREYVEQDNLPDVLPDLVARLAQTGAVVYRRGRLVAVTGAVPGAGVTTVAANLAFALGQKYPGRVALAEVGTGVPELALALDLTPRYTVADLAANADRLDAAIMEQALVTHDAGVRILAHKAETLHAAPLPRAVMRQTLLLLQALHEFVVLDLGHTVDDALLEALTLAETILVLTRLDVPGVRLTRRFVRQLAELGVPTDKIRLVANRYGQRRQLAWKQAEEALPLPLVAAAIPDDPSTLNDALNSGAPLVRTARRASITRSFDKLAVLLNGQAT